MSKERFPDKKEAFTDYDRITDHIQEAASIGKEMDVGQERATWLFSGDYPSLPHFFVWMSDIHYGHKGVDYDRLNEHLRVVEDTPNFAVVFGGDEIDNFNAAIHPHAAISGDAISPQAQAQAFMEKMLHLDRLGKVGAVTHGNHNDFIGVAGYDYYQTFMAEMQAPIFTKQGFLHILVGEQGQEYRVILSHQFWGKSKLNPENAPRRLMEYGENSGDKPDIALLGHDHQAAGSMFDRGGRELVVVDGGTYKTGDRWGNQRFGPAGQGGYTIAMWPNEKRLHIFRDPIVAQQFMLGMIIMEERGIVFDGDFEKFQKEASKYVRKR